MGTNILDFLTEARRILKAGGILKIVEVRSRFESTDATGYHGMDDFKRTLKRIGFKVTQSTDDKPNSKNVSRSLFNGNQMFFEIECMKELSGFLNNPVERCRALEGGVLDELTVMVKPCLYKKR